MVLPGLDIGREGKDQREARLGAQIFPLGENVERMPCLLGELGEMDHIVGNRIEW